MKTLKTAEAVYIQDLPNIDPPKFYRTTTPKDGIDRIILPSGHVVYHIKTFESVQDVLLDRRFIRSPSNEEGAPSVFPTLTPKELLLNTDYPDHARLRALVSRDFTPTAVSTYKQHVQSVTDERLDCLRSQGSSANLFSELLDRIPATVVCKILGLNLDDMSYFRPLSHAVQVASRDDIPGLIDNFTLVYQYLMDLVRKKRESSSDGFINRVVGMRSSSDPSYSDEEFVGVLIGALLGGDQNILTVLTKVVYSLLAAPDLYKRLAEDPSLVPNAMEELFRLIPLGLVSAFPRIASEDMEFGWGRVPAEAALYPDVFAANRDEEVFDDPLEIRFHRTGKKHLQFGYGMHSCMGAALARMEICAVVKTLVTRIPSLRLDVSAHEIPWHTGLVLRRPAALPVRWTKIL